jgi:Holliday junction resolvase RusA-like endonuclease
VIVLDIPRATPSMNATRWKHWRVAHREKHLWQLEIRVARIRAGCFDPKPPQRAKVTIERHGRVLDEDNFVGGLKSVIDSLRHEKLIQDDTAAHMELVPRQISGKPRTIITVENV